VPELSLILYCAVLYSVYALSILNQRMPIAAVSTGAHLIMWA
jgi:hypothetical protein